MLEPKPDMRSGEREKGGESYVMINVESFTTARAPWRPEPGDGLWEECNWCGKVGGKTVSPGRMTPQRPEPDIGDGKGGVKSVRNFSKNGKVGGKLCPRVE